MLLPVEWSCFTSIHGYVKEGPGHWRSLSPSAMTKASAKLFHSLRVPVTVVPIIRSITRRNALGLAGESRREMCGV